MRKLVLLRQMTRRDLAARYRGSLLGVAWALLNPFLMMALYTTVFSVFLKTRIAGDSSPTAFALYLLAGLLPWTAFAEAVTRATTVMREHQNLVKKVVFPLEVIPLSVTCSALVNHGIALAIFLTALLFLRGPSLSWLLLPLVLAPLLLLAAGLGLLLAGIGVFLHDISQAIGMILTVGLFLTPILYPWDTVPVAFQPLLRANPFTALVGGYRRILLEGQAPTLPSLLQIYAVGLVACGGGFWWFIRAKRVFPDLL